MIAGAVVFPGASTELGGGDDKHDGNDGDTDDVDSMEDFAATACGGDGGGSGVDVVAEELAAVAAATTAAATLESSGPGRETGTVVAWRSSSSEVAATTDGVSPPLRTRFLLPSTDCFTSACWCGCECECRSVWCGLDDDD